MHLAFWAEQEATARVAMESPKPCPRLLPEHHCSNSSLHIHVPCLSRLGLSRARARVETDLEKASSWGVKDQHCSGAVSEQAALCIAVTFPQPGDIERSNSRIP